MRASPSTRSDESVPRRASGGDHGGPIIRIKEDGSKASPFTRICVASIALAITSHKGNQLYEVPEEILQAKYLDHYERLHISGRRVAQCVWKPHRPVEHLNMLLVHAEGVQRSAHCASSDAVRRQILL